MATALVEVLTRWAVALLVAALIALGGLRKQSLSGDGAAAAFVVGTFCMAASPRLGVTLIVFFVSSSALTKLGKRRKQKLEDGFKASGQRNAVQVFANGALPTLIALCTLLVVRGDTRQTEVPLGFHGTQTTTLLSLLALAAIGHFAACCGDTWSSELGILSTARPVLITRPCRRVPAGTNGGVTLVGTLAAVGGGLVVGLAYYVTGLFVVVTTPSGTAAAQWPIVLIGAAAGLAGSLIDSVLGAVLQYSALDKRTGKVLEHKPRSQHMHKDIEHVSGCDGKLLLLLLLCANA
jgi:uncharacterized protein (TIGR00297 family)